MADQEEHQDNNRLLDYHVVLQDGTEYELQNVTGWGLEQETGFIIFNGIDFPVRIINRELIESFEPSLPLNEGGEDVDEDEDVDYDAEADADSES